MKMQKELLLRRYVRESLKEGMAADAAHITLDLVGLIPGIGEVADATNALWYAKKGQYLEAAFSLISLIPVAGDAIGKSGKVAMWLGKLASTGGKAAKAVDKTKDVGKQAVKAAEWIKKNKTMIKPVFEKAGADEKLKKYMAEIEKAVDNFVENPTGENKDAQDAAAP